MKLNLDCIPCFQRQTLQAVRFISNDERLQELILKEARASNIKGYSAEERRLPLQYRQL